MTYTGDECGNPQCKELFDVAIKEFADKGYASVKLSDIATRARIESCIMASRFSGKKELYVAAAENIFREYFALADSQSSLIKALLILMRRIRAGRAGVTSSSAGVKFIAGLFEDTEVNKLVWKRIGSEFEKTRLFGMMRSAVSREIMVDGHPFVLLMTLLHRLVVDGASISDAGIAVFKDSAYLRLLAVSTELDDAGIYYADAQDEVDDMIRRIASFYTGIYIVDFDKEELYPFLINPNAICYGPFRESIPYDEVNKIYVANCVHPLDRTEMTNLYANLRRKLETNRNISTNYRRLYGEEYLYTELNITRLDDSEGPPKKALMAYIEKDEQIKLGHGKEEIVRQGIEILYSIEDTEKALSELVKAIGEYHKADSAYIFEYNRDRTVLRMSHEWRAEGALGQESVGMEVPLSEVEKWIVTLDVNNGLILDNVENPSEDNAFSGRLISNKVERMMVVPLSTEEYATGFVAVDNSRYSHGNLLALRAMAAIANSEILRRNQTARDQFVINKLIGSFYFIYFVDLNSDYIKPYVMSASHREKCANPKNYTSIIKAFIGDSAYKSDRGKFNSIANPEYVRSRLMSKESFSMPFTEVADGLIRSMELCFIRIDDSGSQFVMCCIDNTEAIEHQKRLQRVVQNQLKFLVADRTAELQDKNRMLNRMSEDMIDLLGEVTESRDIESGEHIKRVKTFTGILARQMMKDWPEYGLDEEQIGIMVSVSPLHDIGKIAIPDRILLKPGPLTAEEFNLMKTHCEKGCEILKKAPWSGRNPILT
ncbi:MAG TPA: TetR family transcriptional regulator [Bacillota bacterium]|nr:TetR family transcriptional regulator [Bacillota bacterium]